MARASWNRSTKPRSGILNSNGQRNLSGTIEFACPSDLTLLRPLAERGQLCVLITHRDRLGIVAARDAEAKIERARRVDGITRNFENVVGEIVDTVASAATEFEASAISVTTTADRAQQLATVVAWVSEEASTNVHSVASATAELSSSVLEISRQVQPSARMATEAVDQARTTNERVGELSKAAARIGDVVG